VRALGKRRKSTAGFWNGLLLSLGLVAGILALARPQAGGGISQIKSSGIEIMISLDISGSMVAEDFYREGRRINRLEASQAVTEQFINQRPADRIGMMAFAAQPFLVSPLTMDHSWLVHRLYQLRLGMVEDGTAIGSAVSRAANRLKDSKAKSRIIVLLTDGSNNAGKIDPGTAAEAAAALGIKVYTIGVGTEGRVPIPRTNYFGQKVDQWVEAGFDEDTLKKIARITRGRYFRATGTERLREIYDEINQLEKTTFELQQYVNYRDLYPWMLGVAAAALGLHAALTLTLWRRVP
jgi:Ca-activated chloride channel family protein